DLPALDAGLSPRRRGPFGAGPGRRGALLQRRAERRLGRTAPRLCASVAGARRRARRPAGRPRLAPLPRVPAEGRRLAGGPGGPGAGGLRGPGGPRPPAAAAALAGPRARPAPRPLPGKPRPRRDRGRGRRPPRLPGQRLPPALPPDAGRLPTPPPG